MTQRGAPARTRPFREPFDALRRQLDTAPAAQVVSAARDRHPVLRENGSVEALLARMADESPDSWTDREALTRAFLAEHQRDAARGVWSALLLLAYFPMLSHLRFRLSSETLDSQDLDSLVITSFLEVMGCRNCGSHFTHTEMLRLKPPTHAWPLTAVGKRTYEENRSGGLDQTPCPTCGCRTLRR